MIPCRLDMWDSTQNGGTGKSQELLVRGDGLGQERLGYMKQSSDQRATWVNQWGIPTSYYSNHHE